MEVALLALMQKARHLLVLSFMALPTMACSAEPERTVVAGSVELTRTDGSQTGQTGFVFPDDTLLDAGPFAGSCTIERRGDSSTLTLSIDRIDPDERGLASFTLVSPIDSTVAPGAAQVTAKAGSMYEDAAGSCTLVFGGYDDFIGSVDLGLDCTGLVARDGDPGESPTGGSASSGAVSLSASLSLDFCDVVDASY